MPRILPTTLLVVTMATTLATSAFAEVPPRSEYLLTLEVPAAQAEAGKVYYVTYQAPAWDTQVTFTSDAPLERITGTVNKVVGYAVAEMDGDNPTGRILHAGFRLPVATMDTGIPARNGHLQTQWFDTAAYPEITFELADANDARLIKEGEGFQTFELNLSGDMFINGVTKTLAIPARITFMPQGRETRMRVGGDMMALRCQYSINRTDFNVVSSRGMPASRVAEEIQLDQFLVLDSMSPEARVAQRPGGDLRLGALKFMVMMTDLNDPEGAYVAARALVKANWDDANLLNTIAWTIVDDKNVTVRDFDFARETIERCNEVSEHSNPYYLDTLAAICAVTGDINAAVKWQRVAVEKLTDEIPESIVTGIKDNLKKYEMQVGG